MQSMLILCVWVAIVRPFPKVPKDACSVLSFASQGYPDESLFGNILESSLSYWQPSYLVNIIVLPTAILVAFSEVHPQRGVWHPRCLGVQQVERTDNNCIGI